MSKTGLGILLSGCALLAARAMAADGDLDATFGTGGFVVDSSVYPNYPGLAVQADGRIVTCDTGIALDHLGYDFYVRRYEPDGALDTSFGIDGLATVGFVDDDGYPYDDECTAVAIQADGRIVLAGDRVTPGFPLPTYGQWAVARLDANGALDATFGAGTGRISFAFTGFTHGGSAHAVAIDADGRIVVAGGAIEPQTNEDFAIARLLSDGSFDDTFGTGGEVTMNFSTYDVVLAVAFDTSQRVLLTGIGTGAFVVRLLEDGTHDATFGDDGVASAATVIGYSRGLVVDHLGRIVVTGGNYGVNTTVPSMDMMAARFLPDGSLDASFGVDGVATVPFDLADAGGGADDAFTIAEMSDGRLVLVGEAEYGGQSNHLAAAACLDEHGALDATFGSGGRHIYAFGNGGPNVDTQWLANVSLQGGRIVATGGFVGNGGATLSGDIIVRLDNDRIFASAFD
jgi:uncharacterized delta-60 repeat protein